MWGTFLSEPLRIVALVGRYPANQLMRRMPILYRIAPLTPGGCPLEVLCGIRRNFFRLFPCKGQVAYVLLTRAPVASGWRRTSTPAAPRLACVKPVASVHPEPGSNSPLLFISYFFSFQKKLKRQIILFVCCFHGSLSLSQSSLTESSSPRLARVNAGFLVCLLLDGNLTGELISYPSLIRDKPRYSCTTSIVAILSKFARFLRGVPQKRCKGRDFIVTPQIISPF